MNIDDLLLLPEDYQPVIQDGRAIDVIPKNTGAWNRKYPTGCRCPCNDRIFTSRDKFRQHTHTKSHKSFLNDYTIIDWQTLCSEYEQTIKSQKIIIRSLSDEIIRLETLLHHK